MVCSFAGWGAEGGGETELIVYTRVYSFQGIHTGIPYECVVSVIYT